MIKRNLLLLALLLIVTVPARLRAQDLQYGYGIEFPKPNAAQLDSLLRLGVLPSWLASNDELVVDYWPRNMFTVAVRATRRIYMTQALAGGNGIEGDIAIPMGFTDLGLFLYARANGFEVLDRKWLGWRDAGSNRDGILFNGGAGVGLSIPLKWIGFYMPAGMSFGAAFFQSKGGGPAETYVGLEPSLGLRYKVTPAIALQALAQSSYMIAVGDRPRNLGTWNFSIGVEVSLALHRREPLQFWVPPLIVTAADAVRLLYKSNLPPLNILDRNLDFINTELKPLTRFGWTPLGFRGIVRGVVTQSSRASSGNVTALDIEIDSADLRGFRVWRTSVLMDSSRARAYLGNTQVDTASVTTGDRVVIERIKRGDYAFRSPNDRGVRYLRAELFPRSKGLLDSIPRVGSRVEIVGELAWDGDGHMEIHPRRPSDVRVITGDYLNTDDPVQIE